MQEGARPGSPGRAQLSSGGQWGQALGEQEITSLPAAAWGTQWGLCSQASFEAPLEWVQAHGCRPLASPSLSSLTGKVEKPHTFLPATDTQQGTFPSLQLPRVGWKELWKRAGCGSGFLLMS